MLTNAVVKSARPRSTSYKLADHHGLHLYVAPTGLKSFRWRFRFGGREQTLTIGGWPEVTLDKAREAADAVYPVPQQESLRELTLVSRSDSRVSPKAAAFSLTA